MNEYTRMNVKQKLRQLYRLQSQIYHKLQVSYRAERRVTIIAAIADNALSLSFS